LKETGQGKIFNFVSSTKIANQRLGKGAFLFYLKNTEKFDGKKARCVAAAGKVLLVFGA
jgi:hypothetical protein